MDAPKKPERKRGGYTPRNVVVDLTGLPEELIVMATDHQGARSERRRAAALKASQAAAAKAKARQRERMDALRAIHDQKGTYDRNGGTGARILEAAAAWVTLWELREGLGISHGLATQNVDRLWRAGLLEKRENPGRAENVKTASGPAACMFQYRRAGEK